MAWETSITALGYEMLSNLASGSVLNMTRAVTGTGTDSNLYNMTSMHNTVTTGSLTRTAESDGVVIKIRFYSYNNAYLMKQIGLFATVDNGTERLFAVLQNTDGVDILDKGSFPDFSFNVSLFIKSDKMDSITVQIDANALVTQSDFSAAMANVVHLHRSYYSATMSASCLMNANKTYMVWCANGGDIYDATYGGMFIVSNGNYATLFKGTNIVAGKAGNTFSVSSNTAIQMAVLEL